MLAIDELIKVCGCQSLDPNELRISGTDPVFNSAFKLGEVAAAAHASVGVAVNDIWELKTGRKQKIHISVRSAAASLKAINLSKQGITMISFSNWLIRTMNLIDN